MGGNLGEPGRDEEDEEPGVEGPERDWAKE